MQNSDPKRVYLFCGSFCFVIPATKVNWMKVQENVPWGKAEISESAVYHVYVYSRITSEGNRTSQISQCPSRKRKSLGNLVAEKILNYHHNIFRHDPRLLVTRQ